MIEQIVVIKILNGRYKVTAFDSKEVKWVVEVGQNRIARFLGEKVNELLEVKNG